MSAEDTFDFVMDKIWTCLKDTPTHAKNSYFDRFFKVQSDIAEIAEAASITFAPKLLDVVLNPNPAPLIYFKSLPNDSLSSKWGIYAVVMEKEHCRPRVYTGSGSGAIMGVHTRFKHYDELVEEQLPLYVKKSLDEGYEITHKGLFCWVPLPSFVKRSITRLFWYAVESTFAYMFWTMKAVHGDYGMGHLCPWDRKTLEYDGLCSHCALTDSILGDFELNQEELEILAVEREKKFRHIKAVNASNWHYKKMVTDYSNYMDAACERSIRSARANPERVTANRHKRAVKDVATKRYHCDLCDISFTSAHWLKVHYTRPKHLRKMNEHNNPHRCAPCNLGFHNISNLRRHYKSDKHRQNVKKASDIVLPDAPPEHLETDKSLDGLLSGDEDLDRVQSDRELPEYADLDVVLSDNESGEDGGLDDLDMSNKPLPRRRSARLSGFLESLDEIPREEEVLDQAQSEEGPSDNESLPRRRSARLSGLFKSYDDDHSGEEVLYRVQPNEGLLDYDDLDAVFPVSKVFKGLQEELPGREDWLLEAERGLSEPSSSYFTAREWPSSSTLSPLPSSPPPSSSALSSPPQSEEEEDEEEGSSNPFGGSDLVLEMILDRQDDHSEYEPPSGSSSPSSGPFPPSESSSTLD